MSGCWTTRAPSDSAISRVRSVDAEIDDEDLVEQRDPPHHLAHRPPHDRPDRLLLVERREDERDGDALLLLELDETAEIGELGVMEVGFAEPALDPRRHGPGLLGRPVGGGQRFGLGRELVEGRAADRLAGLDHDDGGLGARRDRLGERAEQVRVGAVAAGHGRRAHHDEIGLLRLAQDRVPDVRRLAQDRLAATTQVLLDEGGQRPFGLGTHGHRDAGRHEMEDHDGRAVMSCDRVGEPDRELGMRAATDRDEHAADLLGAALLDDRDVAGRFAHHLVDRRREDGRTGCVAAGRHATAPAEDDEVGFLLGRGLDDALRRVPPDAHDRMDGRALGGVVEHLLEQPPGVPRARGALAQRHPLGHLHDAECAQLAGPRIQHRRPEPDELLGRAGIGDRDEDADRERRSRAHVTASAAAASDPWPGPAARHRSMR